MGYERHDKAPQAKNKGIVRVWVMSRHDTLIYELGHAMQSQPNVFDTSNAIANRIVFHIEGSNHLNLYMSFIFYCLLFYLNPL